MRAPTLSTGCTSRVLEVMKISSAVSSTDSGMLRSSTSNHSTTRSRDAGQTSFGNRWVKTRPSITTKTLLPVPHKGCREVPRIASLNPSARAPARHTAFSAYDVVFRPINGDRSLRGQRLTTTCVVAGQGRPLEADTRVWEARRHVETPVDRVQTCR